MMVPRLFTIRIIFYILLIIFPIDSVKQRSYTTGIAELVRTAIRRSLGRFTSTSISIDSDVFRYTQLSQRGSGGLFAGESCRLSATLCSHDEHCCSGRCICRRWTITGEERCVRKCY